MLKNIGQYRRKGETEVSPVLLPTIRARQDFYIVLFEAGAQSVKGDKSYGRNQSDCSVCREKRRGTIYGYAFRLEKDRWCYDRTAWKHLDLQWGILFFREREEGIEDVLDYEEIKGRLMIRLCDPELNQKYLEDKIYSRHGDFAAVYHVAIPKSEEDTISFTVTEMLMKEWEVSLEQLHRDAILADKKRQPLLNSLDELLGFELVMNEKPQIF